MPHSTRGSFLLGGARALAGMDGAVVPGSETSKEVRVATYTCPMHPEVKQDKPGKCPKCGMALVEKK